MEKYLSLISDPLYHNIKHFLCLSNPLPVRSEAAGAAVIARLDLLTASEATATEEALAGLSPAE